MLHLKTNKMKKLILVLLFLISAVSFGQAEYEKIAITANTESSTAGKVNMQEANGEINYRLPENIPLTIIPPTTHYTPITPTLGGHFKGVDQALGNIVQTTAGVTNRIWFTADQTTITAGTFYISNPTGKGTAAEAIQSVSNDDNQKQYFAQDLVSAGFPVFVTYPAGIYGGQLSCRISTNIAQQRYTVEAYKCNSDGTPIASGVTGAPVGALGVTVIAILDSGLINIVAGNITGVPISGVLNSPISFNTGERVRYHVSAEKSGTAGSTIAMEVFYGNNYNSYYDAPVVFNTTSIVNASTVAGITSTDALNNLNAGKEDIANKATNFSVVNNALYTTTQAVKTEIGINNVAIAYVESTGNNSIAEVGNQRKPYLTIDAALTALPSTGGVIKIGIGTFASPTNANIKSGVSFIGSKKPTTNSTTTVSAWNVRPIITNPTKLIDGTILQGYFSFVGYNDITVKNLGVDVGKDFIDTFYSGVPKDGLVTGVFVGTPPPTHNIIISDVTVLGYSPTALQHALLIENVTDSYISNVSTFYNTHGVVIKGVNITINGIDAHSHAANGLIIKSNNYAFCKDVSVSNVNISSLSGYEGGGLRFVSENSTSLERVNITGLNLKYLNYGITTDGSANDLNINSVNIYDIGGRGIDFDSQIDRLNIDNINIDKVSEYGLVLSSAGFQTKNISNVSAKNITQGSIDISLSGDAKTNIAGVNSIDTVTGTFYLSATGNSRIDVINSNYNSTATIVGNVYGSLNGSGTLTGTLKIDNTTGTQTVLSTDSKGRIFKNPFTTVDSSGNLIQFGQVASEVGASNTLGSASRFTLTNALSGGSARVAYLYMNASNGIGMYHYNGASFLNTGISFNTSGTITANPATVSTELVTKGQLDAVTSYSGTFTPSSSASFDYTLSYWVRVGNVVTITLNCVTNFTASSVAASTVTLPNSFSINSPVNGRLIGISVASTLSGIATGETAITEGGSSTTVGISTRLVATSTGAYKASVVFSFLVN
jgi:hypothetical protein